MKCIVWLGNPGVEYEKTRHNAGFILLDCLQKSWKFWDFSVTKFHGLVSEGIFHWEKILLLKPLTYMNLSGQSVAPLVNFYKLDPKKDLLVLSDDIDLEFATIRYRAKGSAGGQNGLKSIIQAVWTEEFARIKFWIGRDSRYTVSDWVLSKFQESELTEIHSVSSPLVEEKIVQWIVG